MQSVIVIGGSGFLGSKVVEELLARGIKVFAVKNKSIIEPEGVNVIEGGIQVLSAKVIAEINPISIFHCGRPTYARFRKWGRIIAARKASKLNAKLLEQIIQSGVETQLIFASGSLAYGNSDSPHFDDGKINPISYARQYIVGEYPIINNIDNGLTIKLLRFPWLLGYGSWFNWFYLNNIRESGKIPLFGDGSNYMSILPVRDAAKLMIEYSKQELGGGIYNVFNPKIHTQIEFVNKISEFYHADIIDYRFLYPKLEKSAEEAFFSNIILGSNYMNILDNYTFTKIQDVFRE